MSLPAKVLDRCIYCFYPFEGTDESRYPGTNECCACIAAEHDLHGYLLSSSEAQTIAKILYPKRKATARLVYECILCGVPH